MTASANGKSANNPTNPRKHLRLHNFPEVPMSCFAKVISRLDLNDQFTEAEWAWLHSLLHYADAYNAGGSDSSTNPFTATIRRLELAGINPRTLTRVRFLLSEHENKYNASH